jgi:hypothetical protein
MSNNSVLGYLRNLIITIFRRVAIYIEEDSIGILGKSADNIKMNLWKLVNDAGFTAKYLNSYILN